MIGRKRTGSEIAGWYEREAWHHYGILWVQASWLAPGAEYLDYQHEGVDGDVLQAASL